MTLNRWSLDQLVAWIGTVAVIILFVPAGLYLTGFVTSSAEQSLVERGKSLARTLAGQIVEPLLLEDRLALYYALREAASVDGEVSYLCIEDARGKVVAHTFVGGFPSALADIWGRNRGEVARFRTKDNPLMDIPVPIVSGQLGTLHIGMLRTQAVEDTRRLVPPMGIALVGALAVVLVGAHIIAARVSRPLRRLEAMVSRFPQQSTTTDDARISGTREVESLAGGFADMAERLDALEHERLLTQARMIHAERLAALGELAAGLVHEVRNPLDGMLECVRYMEAEPVKGKRAGKYLPMLQDGLQRISNVMQHMLTFARSGHETSIEACPTVDMVDSLAMMTKGHFENHKVKLTIRKSGSCVCLCNRHTLSQAVLNVVLNATEAAEESSNPEVLIQAKCDTTWVYLIIGDSGRGVPEKLRDRIFDPFVTSKPLGRGTGLGLSISRQLVRAVGGEVELSDEPSELGGSCFVIRLPRAPSQECD